MTIHSTPDLQVEEFSQREPLTTRLRGLVRSYPKGVGLIHEFVQNADDAGAKKVRVTLDERTHSSARLPSPAMSELQGPAIVVVNDASFSEDDWRNIQRIGQSGKELDTTKTGRFGLGFNSVYNVTDFPTILTGSRVGIFDPHRRIVAGASPEQHGCAWRLDSTIWSSYADFLFPFQEFGLETGTLAFSGSLFRLPLRTARQAATSEICEQPFTALDFEAIVQMLSEQVGEVLLFLKNVQDIEVTRIDESGHSHLVLAAHTLNRDEVDKARDRLRQKLSVGHAKLLTSLAEPNSRSVVSEFEHHIQVSRGSDPEQLHKYLVVHGLYSDAEGELSRCARKMFEMNEKAVPLAGAAARLDRVSGEGPPRRLFCTLPLPISSPVSSFHVNGFFDLQADRQGLFQDPGAGGGSAVRVNWNRLLLRHACARAVARLCFRLSRKALSCQAPLYDHWPRLPAQETSLLDQLPRHVFSRLRTMKCIAAGSESAWRLPKDVFVLPTTPDNALKQALLAAPFALPQPRLPDFVAAGFAASGASLTVLTPAVLRDSLRVPVDPKCSLGVAPRPCLKNAEWIRALLVFCLSDSKPDDLLGVPLALMHNGTLRAFGRDDRSLICLGGDAERELFARMDSWFIDPAIESLLGSTAPRAPGLLRLSPQLVLANLHKVLPRPDADGRVELAAAGTAAPSEEWLVRALKYLAKNSHEVKPDEEHFKKLAIIPDQFGYLSVMGLPSTPLLPATEDPKTLLKALTAAGVPHVSGTEDLLKAVRAFVDAYADLAVWRLSPGDLVDTLAAVTADQADDDEPLKLEAAAAILDYLATPRGIKDLSGSRAADRVPALKNLRLFPTTTGQLVRLSEGDHHIPADYELPKIDLELGLLDCGKEKRWLPLLQALGVPPLTRARLLTNILLPKMQEFSRQDAHSLLLWLRHHLHAIREEEERAIADTLVQQLGVAVRVQCTDGQDRVPSQLYHPDASFVTDLLGDSIGFPEPTVYGERPDLWLELFETLGMARAPRTDDIVHAVDETLNSDRSYEDKVARVTRIAEFVSDKWEHLKDQPVELDGLQPPEATEWHLSDALSRRAWLPPVRNVPREYPKGLLLVPTSDFYKPSDMLAREAFDLVGSVRPVCRIGRLFRMQASIGLQPEPKLDDVLSHFENALSLAEAEKGPVNERLTSILRRVYEFLGRAFTPAPGADFEKDQRLPAVRSRFQSRRCLIDSDRRLWLPRHCFEESVACFLGRRAKVRVRPEHVAMNRGVRALGRRVSPSAQDYLDFFDELNRDYAERPLADGDRPAVRSAYEAAAALVGEEPFAAAPILLQTGMFASGSEAVLDDAPWLSERAHSAGMPFLDSAIGGRVASAFGVRLLSSAVFERPLSERKSRDEDFVRECEGLQARLRAAQMPTGVHRLLASSDRTVRPGELQRFFSKLRVIPVADLQTTLVWMDDDVLVEGSQGPCDVVFDPDRTAIVVSEEAKDVLYVRIGRILCNELRLDGHDLGDAAANFVEILRVEPDIIDRHLTKLHVRALPRSADLHQYQHEDDSDGFIDAFGAGASDDSDPGEQPPKASPVAQGAAGAGPPSGGPSTTGRGSDIHELADDLADADADEDGEDNSSGDPGVESEDGSPAPSVQTASPQPARNQTSREPPSRPAKATSGRSDESQPTDGDGRSRTGTGSPPPNGGHATRQTSDAAQGDPSPKPPLERGGSERQEQSRTQRGRARTYVAPRDDEREREAPERQERRRRVDQAAVQRALQFERERDRRPKEMPHTNKGYDIESFSGGGKLERLIEVKGLSGAWTDYGVPISRSQFRKALKEGPVFWLYVVEFALEPGRARVFAIPDPAELVDEYWFDGGWRELAKERGGPGMDAAIKRGSLVLIDGSRRGTIKNIHKHGVLMHLDVEFEDHSRHRFVYSPRRVQILPDEDPGP